MSKIHIIHENGAWVEPLRAALEEEALPYEEWFAADGAVPFHEAPPAGVFYNRMSASSHTRGHRYAPELTHALLNWLERHERRVVNSSRALYLEVSKLAQYAALGKAGLATPRTAAGTDRESLIGAAASLGDGPYILKPNRGGKGLGVQLFQNRDALAAFLDSPDARELAPLDGLWLVQDYVRGKEPFITRAEFVGGRFLYAVRVDASSGFELCPADQCAIDDAFCPTGEPQKNKFEIDPDFARSETGRRLIPLYERFLADNGIEIAGIEFITDTSGRVFTYDVNTNTNYNPAAEEEAGAEPTGMVAIARFLGTELGRQENVKRVSAA